MLYQLSYASALKPSKNSRQGQGIARGPKNLPASRWPALWKRHQPVTSKLLPSLDSSITYLRAAAFLNPAKPSRPHTTGPCRSNHTFGPHDSISPEPSAQATIAPPS